MNKNVNMVRLLFTNKSSPWSYPSNINYYNLCDNNAVIVAIIKNIRKYCIIEKIFKYDIKKFIQVNNNILMNRISSISTLAEFKFIAMSIKLHIKKIKKIR